MNREICFADSHCHMHYQPLGGNVEMYLARAAEVGVKYMLCVSTSPRDREAINVLTRHEGVYQSIGVHPLSAKEYSIEQIEAYLRDSNLEKLVAIGETGLDDFRDKLDEFQVGAFELHLIRARELGLPIIMHTRCGADSVVEAEAKSLLGRYKDVRGVAHCFGGSMEFAEFLLDIGWYISFAGNLTYKKSSNLHEVAKMIPLNRILIETDAPFLSPEGLRGQTNEPANVVQVARKLAELKGLDLERVAAETTENFISLFSRVK